MEFGKLEDVSAVNWELPPDDPQNFKNTSPHPFYLGAPAWGSRHWLGKIYPEGTKSDQFLQFYGKNFSCIELNTTHYRIPTEATAKDWISQVPGHFRFCPKVHKDISHNKVGLLDPTLMGIWTKFLEDLSPNLGPCFMQFHESFSYVEKLFLFKFIESWPREFRLSIELRHPSWFQKNKIIPALAEYLHKKNVGLVITDVAGRRDVLHSTVSTDWTMVRLIGNDLIPSDDERLRAWSQRLQDWKKETYLFLHQPDDVYTIEFAQKAELIFKDRGFQDVPHLNVIKHRDLFNF